MNLLAIGFAGHRRQPTQFDLAEVCGAVAERGVGQLDLEEHGGGGTHRDFRVFLAVLLEVAVVGDPVLVADESPGGDGFVVPANLGAGLVGEGDREGQPTLAAEGGLSLGDILQIAVPAVAVLGELFEEDVVVVRDTDADGDQPERVGIVAILSRAQYGERVGGVDVGHAVGHQDHVVVGVGSLAADFVGESNAEVEPGLDVGRPGWPEPVDDSADVAIVGALMRLAVDDPVGEEHDSDTVVRAQSEADRFRSCAGDLDAVAFLHRARGVEHQGHVERRIVDELGGLSGDADEMQVVVQRVLDDVGGDGEAVVNVGQLVVVVEGVDPFLGSYRSGFDGVPGLDPVEGEEV